MNISSENDFVSFTTFLLVSGVFVGLFSVYFAIRDFNSLFMISGAWFITSVLMLFFISSERKRVRYLRERQKKEIEK